MAFLADVFRLGTFVLLVHLDHVGEDGSLYCTGYTHTHTLLHSLYGALSSGGGAPEVPLKLPQQLTLPRRPVAGMSGDASELYLDPVTSPRVTVKIRQK